MLALSRERQTVIRDRLDRAGRVVAADLAREFGTSEDTIRRDLRELAAAGLCRRVYGGALPVSPASLPHDERIAADPLRKQALGRAAAAHVRADQVTLMDAGSTNLWIARSLPEDLRATIVTNAPSVAEALAGRAAIELVMLGGRIDHRAGGSIGARALADLAGIRADLCVVGACAISCETGLTASGAEEAAFKRALLDASDRVLVAVTNEKLATVAPYRVAPLAEVDDLVVERDAPPSRLAGFDGAGVTVHRAGRPAREDKP